MIETGVDHDIILGRVQSQLGGLNIDNQGASSSRKNEEFKPRIGSKPNNGRMIFQGNHT
jgi:hypothetical protein